MKARERRWSDFFVDSAFAVSVFVWGVVGVYRNRVGDGVLLPLVSLLLLNCVVCIQLARRHAPSTRATMADVLQVLPSIVLGPVLFYRAGRFSEWPGVSCLLFSAATMFAAYSLATLSTSFAVFPSVRKLIARGPYRWMRHPAYAGQLAMALVCAAARPSAVNAVLSLLITAATVWRVLVEEQILAGMPGYSDYQKRVRWRLLPFVW